MFLISFCVALGKGLPISKETLLALGEEIGGFLSPFCEEKKVLELTESDVTTLRRAVSFIDNGTKGVKTIGVFIQEGFDCSRVLAELLERRGKKVLVVTCHFEEKASSLNFIKYMKRIQEECLVESKDGIDFLSLGASSQFGLEILGSKRFLELLDLWKTRYDLILLVRKKQMPQEDFFHLCDRGLFFLQGETREQMEKVFQWRKGMFIFARE